MNNEARYIILAGTSKAATTSIFNYLADHPDVCPSSVKQTNYFLDEQTQRNLELVSTHLYKDGSENYNQNFVCSEPNKYYLEASPDYLYCDASVKRISKFSQTNKVHLVFVLRDPSTRFLSWYNFGKQQGKISEQISFQDFYKEAKAYNGVTNPSLMAYHTGMYSKHLRKYMDHAIDANIHVLFYEDLKENSTNFMKQLCEQLEMDSSFFNEYEFKHFKKTSKTKSKMMYRLYTGLRSFYLKFFFKGTIGVAIGNFLKSIFSPIYHSLNTKKLKKNSSNAIVMEQLYNDYSQEKSILKKLIGPTPWK